MITYVLYLLLVRSYVSIYIYIHRSREREREINHDFDFPRSRMVTLVAFHCDTLERINEITTTKESDVIEHETGFTWFQLSFRYNLE